MAEGLLLLQISMALSLHSAPYGMIVDFEKHTARAILVDGSIESLLTSPVRWTSFAQHSVIPLVSSEEQGQCVSCGHGL